jgi:hypothetical protein
VYLYPERKLDFIKNNFGANVKLDYLWTPLWQFQQELTQQLYHESIFGIAVNNSGYFCEAQIKPHRGADTYFFGKFGNVTSNFSENVSINHYQYATGIGLGNEYIGVDVGVNFLVLQ